MQTSDTTGISSYQSCFSTYFDEEDEQVEISVSATLRINDNVRQNFGCACAIYVSGTDEVFITESQWRTKNPVFTTKMYIIPRLYDQQILKFVLLEMTPVIKPLEEYKQLGDCEISLGQILVNNGYEQTLKGGVGDVKIDVAQSSTGRGVLSMIIAFVGMPKDHWLMKNYPQLVICKQEDGHKEWVPIFSSEVVKRSETGQWQPISLPCRLICDNDFSKSIRLLVQDAQPGKKLRPIGHVDIPMKVVCEARNLQLGLIPANPLMARVGSVIIRASSMVERLTFYGHIRKGMRFNFACGIDFAATNRPVSDMKSLHYLLFKHPNAYEKCIEAVGGVVDQYSQEHVCHAWGFAARVNRQLNHKIQLVNDQGSEQLHGVTQILSAYQSLVEKVQFDKPVAVLPSTMEAMKLLGDVDDAKSYLVFLLLIQDDPADLSQFVDYLYANQNKGISIVIIGIGENPFTKTEERFQPGMPRRNSAGQEFDRDFISFLKYRDFGDENISQMTSTAMFSVSDQAIHWIENQI